MKKFFALVCVFSLLTAFTCENEPLDDSLDASSNNDTGGGDNNGGGNTGGNAADLVGTWILDEFSAEASSDVDFGGQLISSDVDVYSTTVDYTVVFTDSDFTTNGSYSYVADVTANGMNFGSDEYTLDNVNGSGGYTVDGNEISTDGAFFEFTFEGMDDSLLDGPQTANFSFSNNGQTLTFSQNQTTTETDEFTGATVTSTTVSSSVWTKQ